MYFAVIDTNVIVSALLKHISIPGKILDYITANVIVPVASFEILDEYTDVLNRSKFPFTEEEVHNTICLLREKSIIINADKCDLPFTDLEDAKFYEIALETNKNYGGYLVTGNIKHFPIEPFIITPREMTEIIEKQ